MGLSEHDPINNSKTEAAGKVHGVGSSCTLSPDRHWRTDMCWLRSHLVGKHSA